MYLSEERTEMILTAIDRAEAAFKQATVLGVVNKVYSLIGDGMSLDAAWKRLGLAPVEVVH